MKTLFLDCHRSASGAMLLAALLELVSDPPAFWAHMNCLARFGLAVHVEPAKRGGMAGKRAMVTVHSQGASTDGSQQPSQDAADVPTPNTNVPLRLDTLTLEETIAQLALPLPVQRDAIAILHSLAAAEAHASGEPMPTHLQDMTMHIALAEIIGVCILMHMLAPEQVILSPVRVGFGQVLTAQGALPVPTPATAWLLQGIPMYSGAEQGECCSATGAALLSYFATRFGNMPMLSVTGIGYGIGHDDALPPLYLRALYGDALCQPDEVLELCCTMDDSTPEAIGFAIENLTGAGALDVFTTAVGMKKNRPGVMLTCTCMADHRDVMLHMIFKHTTTIGVREYHSKRYGMARTVRHVTLAGESIRIKESQGWGVTKAKLEYEDVAHFAHKRGISFAEATKLLQEEMLRT